MKLTIEGTPEEIKKVLQDISSSEEQNFKVSALAEEVTKEINKAFSLQRPQSLNL